jgi:hypothetical protein
MCLLHFLLLKVRLLISKVYISIVVLSSLMCVGKATAYLSEAPFSCSTLGQALVLPTNIRLGWKGLPGTSTLAYYEHS